MQMPNTTLDFRQLCAELVEKIDFTWGHMPRDVHELMTEARAALAAEPQAPTDEEIRDLADFGCDFMRLDSTDSDGDEWLAWECEDENLIKFGRAVLARWGRQP